VDNNKAMHEEISSTLATRYASNAMRSIWSPKDKIIAERKLWIAVMRAQQDLGIAISQSVIADYEKVITNVDLNSIDQREKITRHDVKARIEEFNALAGHELIHSGMTSRDLTESVEAMQIINSLLLVRDKAVAVLAKFGERSLQYIDQPIAGRSHNVPAQITTVGKRFATFAEELIFALERMENLITRYPLRGLKGPVGTSQDALDLFDGDLEKLEHLDNKIAAHLGFAHTLDSTGQIYPRSFDFDVLSSLLQIAAAPGNMATTLRLMAGAELATEGFAKGQVGSSAMPHKMNARSCERINGFVILLRGYAFMTSELAGNQWNEGDVSCSVVRRVALPDAFFAIDGLLETSLTVLTDMGIFENAIEAELQRNLPFLATTKILMAAIKKGVGREVAHEAIKTHALAASKNVRDGKGNDLLELIANDSVLPLNLTELTSLLSTPMEFTGASREQTTNVISRIKEISSKYPDAAKYQAGTIR
jgi:adenylosuccinate lyase